MMDDVSCSARVVREQATTLGETPCGWTLRVLASVSMINTFIL
jgi:hypothetical protein